MRKFLVAFFFILAYLPLSAEEILVYRLQQVTSIKSGQKYVFVQNGRAMINTITSGALQTTDQFATTNLTGNENYVWTVACYDGQHKPYYITDNNGNRIAQTSTTAATLTLNPAGATEWTFTDNGDNTMKICTSPNRTLAWQSAESPIYEAYQSTTDRPYKISVYQLVPTSYTRTLTSNNIGTICLPYQVDNYSGADIYQIAYKEIDQQGNPTQIYYELISGPMQAGYPYVFVPNANQVYFPATEVRVDSPQDYKGFCGTFKNIQDQTSTSENNKLENNYMINATSQFQLCGVGCSLGAYRAYLRMGEVPLSNQVSAPTRQVMAIGQNTSPQFYQPSSLPTALFRTTATPCANKYIQNGHLHILHNGVHYNLLGQAL